MTQTPTEGRPAPETDAPPLLDQANSEYDAGHYERAMELFEKIISLGRESEVVLNNRGAAQDALGMHAMAAASYRAAVALNPSYELGWHNLGNCLFGQELYKEASVAYTRALALNPTRWENASGLARSETKLGNMKKAKGAIDKLKPLADGDDSILLTQADLYLHAGWRTEAAECCKRHISRRGDSVDGHALLGNVYHDSGDFAKAAQSFENALEIAPEDPEIWNNLGYSYFCAGLLDRALMCYDKAIELDLRYKHAWYNKGYALHGADRLEEAVQCYWSAISVDSDDKVLWNNLGNALYNLGGYAESIPKFVEAIRVDPDYEIAWNNIGNALERMGLYAEAIPFHDRSLEIRPGFDYALYAKGVCKSMVGDSEEAYDLILESLDLNPLYDEAWKARSRVARQLGRLDDALSSIETSLSVNPEFDEGWIDRGEMLLSIGDPEEAERSFEAALRCLDAPPSRTAYGLAALARKAAVLRRLGRFEAALAAYETLSGMGRMDDVMASSVFSLARYLGLKTVPSSTKAMLENSVGQHTKMSYVEFLLDCGDTEAASRMLAALDRDEGGPRMAVAEARVKAMSGDVDAAMELVASVSKEERDPDIQKAMGEIFESAGDLRSARACFEEVLSRRPSDFGAALSLTRVFERMGEHRAAIRAADVAIGIDDAEWEPYDLKSRAYAALGESGKSEAAKAMASERLSGSGQTADGPAGGVKG